MNPQNIGPRGGMAKPQRCFPNSEKGESIFDNGGHRTSSSWSWAWGLLIFIIIVLLIIFICCWCKRSPADYVMGMREVYASTVDCNGNRGPMEKFIIPVRIAVQNACTPIKYAINSAPACATSYASPQQAYIPPQPSMCVTNDACPMPQMQPQMPVMCAKPQMATCSTTCQMPALGMVSTAAPMGPPRTML